MSTPADDIADRATPGEHGIAAATITATWSDGNARHEDRLYTGHFSVWREADLLPAEISAALPGMRRGETASATLQPGEAVEAFDACRLISLEASAFNPSHRRGMEIEPRVGRFYPQGFFNDRQHRINDKALPARITRLTGNHMEIDINHPMANFPVEVQFRLEQVLSGQDQRGGRCSSPLGELLQYTGLAAPLADGRATDYGDDGTGMSRMDERRDALFYDKPRLVQHIDATARATINRLYRRLIPDHGRVLDLMASHDSHLHGIATGHLLVLGMNGHELAANTAADAVLPQDLNRSPALAIMPDSLDAVVCTASIEYLTRPAAVLEELLRVLRPGGVLIISFTNRWFPTKAIRIWSELHEFERSGMVTQWLRNAGFSNLHTCSARGWPRPADDKYAGETASSDPVHAVWGYKPRTRITATA